MRVPRSICDSMASACHGAAIHMLVTINLFVTGTADARAGVPQPNSYAFTVAKVS
jgi:hypothetical protein